MPQLILPPFVSFHAVLGTFAAAAMHAASGVTKMNPPGATGFGVTVGFPAYAVPPEKATRAPANKVTTAALRT